MRNVIYLDECGDPLHGHCPDELGADGRRREDAVGVVVGADLADPEERVGDLAALVVAGGGAAEVRVEPSELCHDGLRRDVHGHVVLGEEVVLDGRGPGHGEVDAELVVAVVAAGGEVGRDEGGQVELLREEVHDEAAVGVAVGGAVEECGAVRRAGHVAEGVGARRRVRVARVRERVAERVHRPERRRGRGGDAGRPHAEDEGEEEEEKAGRARHCSSSAAAEAGADELCYLLAWCVATAFIAGLDRNGS
jgi:hypothetical protein